MKIYLIVEITKGFNTWDKYTEEMKDGRETAEMNSIFK